MVIWRSEDIHQHVKGTAPRFEPGQTRTVMLVAYAGRRHAYGFRGDVMGPLDEIAQSDQGAQNEQGAQV